MTKTTEKFTLSTYCVEESVGYLLKRSQTKLAKAVDIELTQHEITSAQGGILMMLASGLYSTAAELARETYIDSASMTRMIDRLEKRGLIVRMPRGDDRRIINLQLTEDGRSLAGQLPACYTQVLNQNFAEFTMDEVTTLKTLLRKLLNSPTASATDTAGKQGKSS
jgi:DNA-binding MarR family transcriptional regulator